MLLTEIAVGLGWDSITEHSGTGTQPERSFISVTALRSRYQNSGQGVGSARDNEVSSPGSDIKENPTADIVFSAIYEHLGKPPLFLLDLWPLGRPICVVCSHEVAEQISRQSRTFPYSVPKSPTTKAFVDVIGPKSIVTAEGDEWRDLRARLNPGFSTGNLMTLLPCMVEKTLLFVDILDQYAASGEHFMLDELCTNLTFDIIGAVTMGVNLCAQLGEDRQSEIVKIFKELGSTYNSHRGIWAVPLVRLRRRKLARKLNVLLRDFISETFEEMKRASQPNATARLGSCSILTLILQDANELTPAIMDRTCDQLKTFLFAGHDTTSILLQWALYELSRTPRAMNAVRRELDYILGSDTSPRSVGNILVSEDGKALLSKMRYTSAVIKETLRLYPPSGSARYAERGSGLTLRLPNGRVSCVDGLVLYNCATIIQRDETVYGESKDEFAPERWLQDDELNMHLSQNKDQDRYREARFAGPPSAWRPFERGPRNCIGQELAMIEARLILASVVRRYDFAKVGLGEIAMDENGQPALNSHGQYETKSKLYNVITPSPVPRPAFRILLADF
ncbi:hypothetical protein CNMCM8980_003361 [Aspergillus fumigatiaffinis]|nr:hypothetical protein CNMCM5878_002102 [Aspergillus fumigatiaffinis]KAF4249541.1 hypothetical protein CNMCM8980_003361 [Aspergillus fumigatiaffinis]